MKRYYKALPLLGALLTACSSPSPVDEIVTSNLAARGGKENIQAVQSIRQTGRATASGGRVAKVVYEIKRPGLFRLEFRSQGTTAVFAHDGEIGWQVDPRAGVFEPEAVTPEVDSEAGIDERDIEGHLVDWREKGHAVELLGTEVLPAGEAFKLKVTLKDGATRYDYVDVKSRQIVRADKTEMIRGRVLQLEESYSDFREVGGLVFPHLIETRVTDRPETISIIVENIELDPDLDDTRFQMPQ
jgi:outer membrane lipoprotein-sorting protein